MKKICILFFTLFSFPVLSSASEKISAFDTVVRVNEDATINVTENISYDYDNLASGRERHGLYRDIPYKYQADYGAFNFDFSDISVNTDNFEYYSYGKYLRIDTNPDPDIHVHGTVPYIFNYTVGGAIGYFDDFDEIYWNTTGDEWDAPMQSVSAKVILPKPLPREQLRISCYEGVRGSTENCSSAPIVKNGLVEAVIFSATRSFSGREGMTVAVGFPKRIVYEPSWRERVLKAIWDNKIFFLPVIVFFVMFYLWYTKGRDPKGSGVIIPQYDVPDGLSPMEVGVIVNEKYSNKDISAEIIYLAIRGYLKIVKTQNYISILEKDDYILEKIKNGSSEMARHQNILLESLFSNKNTLAAKKFEALEKQTKENTGVDLSSAGKTVFKGFKIFVLVLFAMISVVIIGFMTEIPILINISVGLMFFLSFGVPFGVIIFLASLAFKGITSGGVKVYKYDPVTEELIDEFGKVDKADQAATVRISLLNEKFYEKALEIGDKAYDAVVSGGYYDTKPTKYSSAMTLFAIVIVIATFFGGEAISTYWGVSYIISFVLSAIVIGIFSKYMPKKTEKGIETYEYLLGLKEYLQIAEKDRLEFHNAPEKSPELFEKLLPYAMVLGVSDIWAKEFADIYTSPPDWYHDPSGFAGFNAVAFADSVNSFSSFASGALTSAPGGSSGSGGGGSSGGGGGGGGGGSH